MNSLLKTVVLVATFAFAATISNAQITGTVTVPSVTYPTLASAITALNTQGVGAGGATISLTAGSPQTAPTGGYKLGSATLNASLSAANTLTINGNANTITSAAGTGTVDGVFYLQGTDYVTINALNIAEAATNTTTTTQMEYGYALVKLNNAAPYDGCQNVSITNCKIALVATNSASKGIYLFHSVSTAPGTTLSTTGALQSDANSFNTFAGDTLQNCSYGIYQYGISSAVGVYDRSNVIGTAANGNVFNTGGSTNAGYGVYTYYDSILTIQNNKFNIATGHNAYVYQIYTNTGKGNLSITGNAYNVTSTITTGYVYGLYNYGVTAGTGHYDAAGTFSFSNNTFTGSNTTATSSYIYEIYNYYTPWGAIQINNNSISNVTWSGTGYIYGLYSYYNACNSFTATGNNTSNITRTSTTGGYVYGGYFYDYNATGGFMNVSNNTYNNVTSYAGYGFYAYCAPSVQQLTYKYNKFTNVTGLGSGSFYPMYSGYGVSGEIAYDSIYNVNTLNAYMYNYLGYYSSLTNVHDNYVSDITLGTTAYYYGYFTEYSTGDTVHDNVIKNITQTGSGGVYAMYTYTTYGGLYYKNTVSNISVATGSIYGLYTYATTPTTSYYNNNFNNLNITSATGSGSIYGMYLQGGTGSSVNIYNNFVSGITVPGTYSAMNLYGMYLASTMTYNIYHNTIRMNPIGSTTQFGATGLYYSSSATSVDLRNNIIYVDAAAAGSGTVVALRRSTGTTGTPPNNLASTSNSNIYYAPNAANSFLYGEGSTSLAIYNTYNQTNDPAFNTPCGLYKTFMVPRESASFTEKNLSAGTLANTFLPSGNSYAKSVGVPTTNPAVTTDYAGGVRPSTPDAGALQFNGISLDAAGPIISFIPLTTTSYCTTNPVLVATITDPSGVNTTTGTAPRVYYKKSTETNAFGGGNTSASNGWKYVEGTASGSTFTFNIDYSLLTSAPAGGTNIQYFIIAQDNASTPNVGSNTVGYPSTFCPASVALPAGAGPVLTTPTINNFTIQALPTSFTTGQTYKSLCNSGTTVLSLTPVPSGAAIQWQQSVGGSAFANITGAITTPYTTSLLTTTTVFRAQIYCGASVVATSSADTIVVANPALLSSTPATRCGYGPITLSATGSTGTTINWYASATSLTPLYTGASYAIPALGATTNYYVSANVPNAGTEVVGKTVEVPYSNYYPSGPYGVTFSLASSTNIYSTTVYPAGSGTFQIQLLDNSNIQVSGTSTLNITINPSDVGTAMVIPLNFLNIPAGTYKLSTTSTYTGTPTMNIEYLSSNFPYPYTSPSGNTTITNSQYSTSVYLNYYYFFYNIVVSGPCASARTMVTATVNPAPAITASSPNIPGICTGASASLNVTSSNSGYTYVWTPSTTLSCNTCNNPTANPTANTSYVVTATDNTSGAYAGCVTKDSVVLAVNNPPAAPTISPVNPVICAGGSVTLNASTGAGSPTIFSENFSTATTASPGIFTISTGASNTNSSTLGPWQIVTAPYTNSGSSSETFGGTGNKYIHADANSQSAQTTTYFTTTSSYNTTGYSSLSLTYNQYYQTYGGDSAAVDVSANNGATWTVVYNQAGTTAGTGYTTFAPNTINLNSFIGATALKVRFRYFSNYGWYWAVDDIVLSGTPPPISAVWQNVSSLYKNAALTVPMTLADTNRTVYSAPLTSTIYTVKGNLQGCLSAASAPDTVKVNPLPITTITPNPSFSICTGQTTTLRADTGVNAANYTYQWSNSSGIIAGATGYTFTTGTAGTYTVKIVNTITGCNATTAVPVAVIVNPLPTATATAQGPTTFCGGGTVQINSATNSGTLYQWLNNGVAVAGQNSTNFVANTTGNYSVLITNGNGCQNTSNAVAVTVNVTPAVITPLGSTTFCTGYSVGLQANTGANLAYQWQMNGAPLTGQTSSLYTANVSGNYSVIVTNTSTNCSTISSAVTVTVGPPPSSAITPSPSVAICDGSSLTLNGNPAPGLTYQWYKNGVAIAGANGQTYTQTYTIAGGGGNYTVNVSSGVGCSSTTATPTAVTVNPLPTITATPTTSTTFCQGDSVIINSAPTSGLTYQWYNGTTAITTATNASYKAVASGSYIVKGTNINGCVGTSNTVPVTVNPLPTVTAATSNAITFCQGNYALLTATTATGLSYQWKVNTVPVAGATASTDTATSTGNYSVTVTDINGCKNTSSPIVITVNPLPNVSTTPSGIYNICQGDTATISIPTGFTQTYQWQLGGANITGATTNIYKTYTAGSFTVTATNTATTCQATSAPVVVVVNALPLATLAVTTGATTICLGDSVLLSANTGANLTYQWRLNGNNIVGATNLTYYARQSGSYTVRTTNAAGCSATSTAVAITVNPVPPAYVTYTSPISFCDGSAVVLNANPGTGLTYQWLLNGAAIGNTTTSNISSASGAYAIKVTNTFGCTTISTPVNVTAWQIIKPVITMNNFILSTGTYNTYQWWYNNQPLPGKTQRTLTPAQTQNANGAYKVTVTDNNNCQSSSDEFFVNSLGITSTAGVRNAIKIYPNPSNGIVHIDAPVRINAVLRDVTGKIVISEEAAKEINIAEIANGLYLLYISDAQGHLLKAEKITKTDY